MNDHNLTFKSLIVAVAEARKLLPNPAPLRYLALRPDVLESLRSELDPLERHDPLFYSPDKLMGIELYPKVGQVADCWAFEDHKALTDYLEGVVSEAELVALFKR